MCLNQFYHLLSFPRQPHSYLHPANISIQANHIFNSNVGINVYNNLRINHRAYINYNLVVNPDCSVPLATSINVAEVSTPPSAKYRIEDNSCYSQSFGITATSLNSAIIDYNNIYLSTLPAACSDLSLYDGAGIQSLTCQGNEICGNSITAVSPGVAANTYTAVLESQNNLVGIDMNSVTNANTQVQFNSTPISGDNLWYNAFDIGNTGILSTNISSPIPLGLPGNATDNGFTPSTLFENVCVYTGSTYFYSTGGYDPITYCIGLNLSPSNGELPHNCSPNPSFPPIPLMRVHGSLLRRSGLDSLTLDSLRLDSLTADTLPVFMDTLAADSFKLIPDSMTIAQLERTARNQDIFAELQDTNSVLAKEGVVRTLWDNPNLLNGNGIFQNFNDSISMASMGELLAIDTAINGSANSSSDPALLASVNSITPANNIEVNLQTVAATYLSFLINDTLSSSELAALRTVANQCPAWDGNGVYQARALLLEFDSVTVYNDSWCVGNPKKEREGKVASKNTPLSNDTFNLYPNPNSGGFTLSYQMQEGQTGKFIIYSMLGEKIAEYALDANTTKMKIVINNLNNGIYIYDISVNNSIVKRDKMIVIK